MTKVFRRLLETHSFLMQALETHAGSLSQKQLEDLLTDAEAALDKILAYDPDTVDQIVSQIERITVVLTHHVADAELGATVSDLILGHLSRLLVAAREHHRRMRTGQGHDKGAVAAASWLDYSGMWNALGDRVVVIDTSHRYIFANAASGRLHGRDAREFQGLPLWSIVGDACYERVTRPLLTRCFDGESVAIFTERKRAGQPLVSAGQFDPVRDRDGRIVSVIGIIKDISGLPVAAPVLSVPPAEAGIGFSGH